MPKRYDVGYKKPPKKTQFKAGQSGNPKGRPKGSQNIGTSLNNVLSEIIVAPKNGKPKKITKHEIFSRNLVAIAINGNLKAAELVLKYAKVVHEIETFEIMPEDDMALEKLKSKVKASLIKQETGCE